MCPLRRPPWLRRVAQPVSQVLNTTGDLSFRDRPSIRPAGALLLVGALALLTALPAAAHEPLWGETPSVFGFGVIHPEVRFGYRDAGATRRGGIRQRLFESETMVQYAPSIALNLMLEIPWMQSVRESRGRRVSIGGLGDIELLAKRRFSVRQSEGLNVQQSLIYGVKLPTGADSHRDVTGRRADPHDQPGTGNPGLVLGYAWDRERVQDTVWASMRYHRDLGGGFRMGDMLEVDSAYGWWFIRANEAAHLGFNLAVGLHGELHAADPLGGAGSARNQHRLLGVQVTPIFTRGNHQLRLGVFVPFVRSGPADHADFPMEFRFAFETFF